MGWDYYTYMAQPAFFIEEILLIMNQESQKERRETSKTKTQANSLRQLKHG